MEIYRVTKVSPAWLHKAYDYVRTDAFIFGQDIPINFEYSFPETIDGEYKAVVLIDEGKPIAGCKITFPKEDIGKIGRVCVARQFQKQGYGRILIGEAEKWIIENKVSRIVINSQDRAMKFYEKLGYILVAGVDPGLFEQKMNVDLDSISRDYVPQKNELGFSCVLVEKIINK